MLGLVSVKKHFITPNEIRIILDDVSLLVPRGMRLGILGSNGSGKTTIINILAGLEPVDSGDIIVPASVSWPIGYAGGLHRDLTADENTRIVARIYSLDPNEVSALCHEFSELGDDYFQPVSTFSAGMRARFAFALSMAFDFDAYLADDVVGVGDGAFRRKCEMTLEARIEDTSFIFFSRNIRSVQRFCTDFAVLRDGKIIICDNHQEAHRLYEDSHANNLQVTCV